MMEEELSIIIINEINKETYYKDIFTIIKSKIEWFINIFWKTNIFSKELLTLCH